MAVCRRRGGRLMSARQSKRRLTLERKLLMAVIPMIIVSLLVVSVIVYSVAKRTIQNRVSEYMEQYLVQLSTSIDNKLETTLQLNAQLSVNAQLSEILKKYDSASPSEKLSYRQDVENIFITIMSIYDNIRGIYIFDSCGNEFYLRNSSGLDMSTLEKASWYQDALARQGAHVIFLDSRSGRDNMAVGIARSIVNIYNHQSYGVALIEIPYSLIAETVYGGSAQSELQQGAIVIRDDQEQLIYSTRAEVGAQTADTQSRPAAGTPQMRVFYADGAEQIRITYVSARTGWTYDYVCEMKYLMKDMARIKTVITVLVVAVSLITVCLLIVFSHRTFRPLGELVTAMQKVKEGDYSVQVRTYSQDEFEYLGQTFNDMAGSIRDLIQKVYSAQLMQKDARLKVLQQQINPHFLYNTFETMRGIALCENNENLADMIKNISEFMRYNMYGSDGTSTLETELHHVTNYINVMDYRFDNKIRLQIDLPERLLRQQVPKFTLQPIVENAVLHGFRQKKSDCEIRISGRIDGRDAWLEIADNGSGIDARTLAEINAGLDRAVPADGSEAGHVSIGILNVNSRLRLNYGERYGVRLSSREGEGTTAEIHVPVLPADGLPEGADGQAKES